MVIRIRKRPQEEWLLLYILVMPFLFFALVDVLMIPAAIKYTIDLVWLFLAVAMLILKVSLPNPQLRKVMVVSLALLLVSFVGFVVEYQSVLYYLWGLRNNARFFVFFAACAVYLSKQTADDCMKLLDKLFWINLVVTAYQFFIMGKQQDHLGGIFGVDKGCNAYTNIFLVIVTSWHIVRYMNKKESFRKVLAFCLPTLIIAALAELKFFYGEFVVILIAALLITRFSMRKVWILLGGTVSLVVGAIVLDQVFDGLFSRWFNLTSIWNSLTASTGYTNANDMNRLTVFPIVMSRFLDSGLAKLFGLGLGNCDVAEGYDFLTSAFYHNYAHTHYTWFSSAMMLLETGLIGYGLYNMFFIRLFFAARQRLKASLGDASFCELAMIVAMICPLLIIYNSSLRTEAAYMLYFVLSLPFLRSDPIKIDPQPQDEQEVLIHDETFEET